MQSMGKMGDRIVSDLDIFYCGKCSQKFILVGDKTELRMRVITLYCLKCRETTLFEIRTL